MTSSSPNGPETVVGSASGADAATVTVVVTTYNHARFLAEALDSVFAQTRPADEVIVIDDGSTDHPERVVADFPRARIISQANGGPSRARNTGLREASGELIAFLDADDTLWPEALALAVEALTANPRALFAYGAHQRVDTVGRPLARPHYVPIGPDPMITLLEQNPVGMASCVVYRRQGLLDVGGFDVAESVRRAEDYDSYIRLARIGGAVSFPQVAANYRIHGANASLNQPVMLRAALAVLANHDHDLSPAASLALRRGRRNWREHYVREMLKESVSALRQRDLKRALAIGGTALQLEPFVSLQVTGTRVWRLMTRHSREQTLRLR